MLTCLTCSKQRSEDGEEDSPRGTPNTKKTVQTLTTQIKDMALKVSGKGKPEVSFNKGERSYTDFDTISEGASYKYAQPGSSSSTPARDFTRTGRPATRSDSRFGGDESPGGLSISAQSGEMVLEDGDEPKEWTAQVEPGVHITFVSLPRGGNDLKRIRFSREMFNKWQAQRWWGENFDRIMELYNVQRFNQQAMNTPGRSEDGRDSTYSRLGSARESPRMTPRFPPETLHGPNQQYDVGPSVCGPKGKMLSVEASRTTTSSRDEASVSICNASDVESEWVEEDEPGVHITIKQLADGSRELRRVRFSREKFGEVHAKIWWETNRERIHSQYLC